MHAFLNRIGDFVSWLRGGKRLFFALILGLLTAMAFAPYPGFILFLLCMAFGLLLVDAAENWKQAFLTGLFFGLGQFGLGIYWIGHSFSAQTEVPTWLAPFAIVLLAAYLSLFMGAAFTLAKSLWPKRWPEKALIFAASFALFEFLRGVVFTGFPWNPAAAIWWPFDFMMQPVALIGTYGLGLLTVFAGGLLAPLFTQKKSKGHFTPPLLATGILVVLASSGLIRMADSPVSFHENVRLRLVQANIPQLEKWDERFLVRNFDRHIEMSNQPGEEPVTHVVWSESSIPYSGIYDDPAFQAYVASRLGNTKTLISGANRVEPDGEVRVFNSVFALQPDGVISATYDKAHLVPFGEFIPWRGLLKKFGLDTLAPGSHNFSEGPGPRTLSVPGLPSFGPLVCYEIIFPGAVIEAGNRPHWLLNLTNDAWFGTSSGPHQHFTLARLRAIEEGLAVVRVAGTGISGVIDPYGRTLGNIDLQTQGILDTALPRALDDLTLFARTGNATFFALFLFAFGWVLLKRRKISKN